LERLRQPDAFAAAAANVGAHVERRGVYVGLEDRNIPEMIGHYLIYGNRTYRPRG